jgi:DNA-binding transcriptional regulator YbjK
MVAVNHERRALVADAAIAVLAESGAGGLTHRAVDVAAQLPDGTTSNYFRTRLALLRAAALRMSELHWKYVAELAAATDEPGDRVDAADMLGRLLMMPDGPIRVRNAAQFELFMAGNRIPELRPILEDLYAAAMRSATLQLESAGVSTTPDRVRLFARALRGLAFDQLTMPQDAMTADEAAAAVRDLLTMAFGTTNSSQRRSRKQ